MTRERSIGRPKGSGSKIVYDALRSKILAMEMLPGSAIDENALVAEFGVSRTPVREALLKLSSDGLVALEPNRGASVRSLDLQEVPELVAAMEICMRVTSRWAAARRRQSDLDAMSQEQARLRKAIESDDYVAISESNSRFHAAIAHASRNHHMAKLYGDLLPQYHRLTLTMLSTARWWASNYRCYLDSLHSEHQMLMDAIARGDTHEADRLARTHVEAIGHRLQLFVRKSISDPIVIDDPMPLGTETLSE